MLVSQFISIDRQQCLSLLNKREVDLLMQKRNKQDIYFDKKVYGNDENEKFYYDIHTIYRDKEFIKYATTNKKVFIFIK